MEEEKDKKEKEKDKKEEENDKKEEEKENEKKQKKVFKERANDRAMTEMFLTNFILKNSDILILVVGEMTYSKQLLIDKIKEESKKLKLKKIFIVHNLQTLRKKEQVEQYIHNILFKNINLNLIKPKLIDINEDCENDDNNKEKDIKNDKKDSIDINNINLQKKEDMNNKINLKYINLNNINLNNINLKENNLIKDGKKGNNIIEIEENEKEKEQNLNKKLKKNKENKIILNKNENNIINNKLDEEEDEKEDEKEGKNDNNKDILKDYKDSDNDSDSSSNEINKLKLKLSGLL